MKRNYKILLAIVLVSATLFAFKLKSEVDPNPDKDKLLLELLTFVLEKGHYSPATIDDTFSKGLYKDYVSSRPVKTIFLAV
jgi:carboxyl-terminal processing protease